MQQIISASELATVHQHVGIAADHGGYELKEYLVSMLRARVSNARGWLKGESASV